MLPNNFKCDKRIDWEVLQGDWKVSDGKSCRVDGQKCTFVGSGNVYDIEYDDNIFTLNGIFFVPQITFKLIIVDNKPNFLK